MVLVLWVFRGGKRRRFEDRRTRETWVGRILVIVILVLLSKWLDVPLSTLLQ